MDRESENKTGLIYANARYLDPDTGRFLSFDPFEGYDDKPISLHRYMYAYQNPVRYTDLDGLKACASNEAAFNCDPGTGLGSNKDQDFNNDISNSSDDAAEQTRVQENRDQWERHRESFPKNSKFETTAENETGETSSKSMSASEKRLNEIVSIKGFISDDVYKKYQDAILEEDYKEAALSIGIGIAKKTKQGELLDKAIDCFNSPSSDCMQKNSNSRSVKNKKKSSPVPESYLNARISIDMNDAPESSATNAAGFKSNANWYWKQVISKHPEMFDNGNKHRIEKLGLSPKVNKQWVKYNKTHKDYMRETLDHHHVNQQNIAIGIPRTIHQKWSKALHPNSNGRKK